MGGGSSSARNAAPVPEPMPAGSSGGHGEFDDDIPF
jgi:hypothetical protein